MIFMAKPIKATPTLIGQDAIDFVKLMRQRAKQHRLSELDKEFLKFRF